MSPKEIEQLINGSDVADIVEKRREEGGDKDTYLEIDKSVQIRSKEKQLD